MSPEQELIEAINAAWHEYLRVVDAQGQRSPLFVRQMGRAVGHTIAEVTECDWLMRYGRND